MNRSTASVDTPTIGGAFALEQPPALKPGSQRCQEQKWAFQNADGLRLASARSALWLVARILHPRTVWLPSYLCRSILDGFKSAGAATRFFSVNEHLRCDDAEWLKQVNRGDVVLRIRYFGFDNRDPVLSDAAARGAHIVDDAAQSLFSDAFAHDTDYVVYSPRKFLGIPDGGILLAKTPFAHPLPAWQAPPEDWWRDAVAALTLRRDFDNGGKTREWFARFQSAEAKVPAGAFAMSELTARILDSGLDFDSVSRRRRANYRLLLANLGSFALFPQLPDDVVPLGFPVRVTNRDSIRTAMFEKDIFPPTHWSLDEFVPKSFGASHRLAAEIMTLPCDQRYGEEDMLRIVEQFSRTAGI